MAQQISTSPETVAPDLELHKDPTNEVAPDVAWKRLAIVNIAFYGFPGAPEWVLIDAGIPGSAPAILKAAHERFGANNPPAAIVLTHGHFDHVGALETLAAEWNVPIYAHELEFPYLNGTAAYPPPDPGVGGGLMARMAGLYPRDPVNVSQWLQPLPADGSIPVLPGWKWVATPGHTPGQVALWREEDFLLLAADAFITTAQESAFAVALQKPELHGPPMYYTQDWAASRESVRHLAELEPEVVVTGHGPAMRGPKMRAALNDLARDFDRVAVPKAGFYVQHPTRAENGTAYAKPG